MCLPLKPLNRTESLTKSYPISDAKVRTKLLRIFQTYVIALQCSRPWIYRTGIDIYQILDDFFVRDYIRFKGFKGKHTTKLIRSLHTYFMYVT